MSEFSIKIDRLAFGGSGVGRVDGKVCFVPFSCPGDELKVRTVTQKKSYSTASITSIVKPSTERVEPVCQLFGKCGGCNWQHVDYQSQLTAKRGIFADTLWRGARIDGELVADVIPSPDSYSYRSRVQFKLHAANGEMHIGFYRQGTHFVEDAADGCPIALPVINQSLGAFRAVLKNFPEKSMLPQINIDSAGEGVIAVVNYIGDNIAKVSDFFSSHRQQLFPLTGLYLQTGRKSTLQKVFGDELLTYALEDSTGKKCLISYKPGGFSQVNSSQNQKLLELVRELAEFKGNEKLLDLYCGNGNFSLPLARDVASVTGIEEFSGSIASAIENAERNGILNAEFICADASAGLKKLNDSGAGFDLVILDPPRSGAGEVIPELCRFKPDRIIYISCDPSTFARDCAVLTGSGAYQVVTSIPVDMFPQTYHLESITLLRSCG
jgi:23S rRNA (uracil1939-C5)-methyltransferase